jgi:hypothetical protein
VPGHARTTNGTSDYLGTDLGTLDLSAYNCMALRFRAKIPTGASGFIANLDTDYTGEVGGFYVLVAGTTIELFNRISGFSIHLTIPAFDTWLEWVIQWDSFGSQTPLWKQAYCQAPGSAANPISYNDPTAATITPENLIDKPFAIGARADGAAFRLGFTVCDFTLYLFDRTSGSAGAILAAGDVTSISETPVNSEPPNIGGMLKHFWPLDGITGAATEPDLVGGVALNVHGTVQSAGPSTPAGLVQVPYLSLLQPVSAF